MSLTTIDTKKNYVKMKKDVYEHLAKTFLDKKKKKNFSKRKIWIAIVPVVFVLFIALLISRNLIVEKKFFSKSLYVIVDRTPVVLDYNFSGLGASKKKALSFDLDNVDLSEYSTLELSIRTGIWSKTDSTIKIQIENTLLERDIEYILGVNKNWRKFRVPLESFELIKDWSSIKNITFVVEDWNVSCKEDKILIDDVRFIE